MQVWVTKSTTSAHIQQDWINSVQSGENWGDRKTWHESYDIGLELDILI